MAVGELRGRREQAESAQPQVERHHVVLVVEALFLLGIESECDLAAVGGNVVVMGRGIRARQLVPGAREEITRLAALDVDDKEMRHAAIGEPAIPPPVRGVLDDVRLHLVVLECLVPFRELAEALRLRPDPGNERDAARIREPLDRRGAGRDIGHAPRLAPIGRDHVDLRLGVVFRAIRAVALGDECDPAAIGRPAGLAVLFARRREAPRLASERREDPQARSPLVLLHVVRGDRDADLRAIG
jgi:hypothetical protein